MLPAFYGLPMGGPEVGRQCHGACVQQIAIVQRLVVLIVVGGQAQSSGLDTHVDVFGHQDHFTWRELLAQGVHHPQNLVVGLALRQAGGQRVVQCLSLEKQLSFGLAMASGVKLQANPDVGAIGASQCVKTAAGLTRVACNLCHAFFVSVQFFQNNHGQEDVMLFKTKQAHGIVHQDIGVQHEQFGRTRRLGAL